MQPITDRFRFWYANLAFIDRSFKHKTIKFAVCTCCILHWRRKKLVFFLIWPMTADCETVVNSLVFLERCLWLSVLGWTQIELSQNVTPFLKSTVCDNSNPGLRSEACMKSTIWEPHFALSQNTEFIQGHPTSVGVFCKISVRRSKYCLEFSIIWGRLKISRWSFHLCKIFDAYLKNSLWFSEV